MCKKNKIKVIILTLVVEIILSSFLIFNVSADIKSDNDFCVAVDYFAEKIRIINPSSTFGKFGSYNYNFIEISDNENILGGVFSNSSIIGKSDLLENISIANDGEYMYALKAFSDELLDFYVSAGKPEKKIKALQSEKWYPIYGGGINISSVIPLKVPKDSKKHYYIAVRKADDYFDTETGYKTRIAVCIKPRYNPKNLNKLIEYDAINEKIILSQDYIDDNSLNIVYRYDYFQPLSRTLTKNASDNNFNINVSGKLFYLGGHVYISTLPFVKDGELGQEVVFARSREIKFKIPKVPNMPAVRADVNIKKITSIRKDSLEWSLTGGESFDSWQNYTRTETSLSFNEVLSTFYGLSENNIDENGNYIIYFRTKAVAQKTPASLPKKILIPANLCG